MDEVFIQSYRLDQTIGTGGLSTVYSAVDTRNGRKVAIKIAKLPPDPAAHDSFVKLFLQEVSLISRLRHSAFVTILDQGTTSDGNPFFVMEFLDGVSLDNILPDMGPLSIPIALSLAVQVAGALGAAHSLGFIHRDVKPANIFVSGGSPDSWTIKLLDLGIAAQLSTATGLTQGGGFFGSVSYMSPEQILGKPLSAGSDIWQLGVTLFEMVTGYLPFEAAGTFETMTAIVNAEVGLRDGQALPPPVSTFLKRCLAKDPMDRPRDGAEAARILQEIQNSFLKTPLPDLISASPASIRVPVGSVTVAFPMPVRGEGRASPRYVSLVAHGLILVSLATLALVSAFHHGHLGASWIGIVSGAGLILSGILFGKALTRVLAEKRDALSAQAEGILAGARKRDQLSQTLAVQVDIIAARCKLVDEKFLAMSMAIMVDEFETATTLDDRQKSLMNAVSILEKLTAKLTPWYVRQEKLIALCVSLVGIIGGLVTIAENIMKLAKTT